MCIQCFINIYYDSMKSVIILFSCIMYNLARTTTLWQSHQLISISLLHRIVYISTHIISILHRKIRTHKIASEVFEYNLGDHIR